MLPQAFAQVPTISMFGNLKYVDETSSERFLSGIDVCAYSEVSFLNYEKLIVNNKHVCATSSGNHGFFYMNVPTTHNGNTVQLKLGAIPENDDVVIYKDNRDTSDSRHEILDNLMAIDLSTKTNNFNYGIFTVPNISPYLLITVDTFSDLDNWYNRNVQYNPAKTSVTWDPLACAGIGIAAGTDRMTLSHSYKVNDRGNVVKDCRDVINSGLTNKDTIAHEYGHIQFFKQYDLENAPYPSYLIGSSEGFHSPVHDGNSEGLAWVEGWAFFMAQAFSGDDKFQPSYMVGQWDFEDRTHNEVSDSRFAGKSFVDGYAEGNIASAFLDAIDTTNESGDDKSNQLTNIWTVMKDDRGNGSLALTFADFHNDWTDASKPNLDSIFTLNTIPVTIPSSCTPETSNGFVFYDHFTCDLSKWTESGGNQRWDVKIPDERQIPRKANDNTVANAANCDTDCNLAMTDSINLSGYSTGKLQFWRYLDSNLDRDEGLRLEISSDGTNWTELSKWTKRTGHVNDSWTKETVNLNSYLSSNVQIRFVALASSSSEEIEIDDVIISASRSSGGGGTNPPQTPPRFVSIDDITINEGETKTITAKATDSNGDSIVYSLSTAPSWVSINSNSGIITINTPAELDKSEYPVRVRATDNDGFATEYFAININEINKLQHYQTLEINQSKNNPLYRFQFQLLTLIDQQTHYDIL